MNRGRDWSEADDDLIARYAAAGLSARTTARAISPGVTRNMVLARARTLPGVRFDGAQVPGPGCSPEAAARGWATRRQREGEART